MEVATSFKAPKKSIGDLDAEAAAKLIAAAGDVALVVDRDGVIRDLAFGNEALSREGYGGWVGQPWIETVTIESRPKVEALLREAASTAAPRWRQVNHPSAHGADVPVLYSAVQVGDEGRIVAVGRDLRSIAVLQQRLIEAQQSMERDYARLRHAETRYRLLFQIASEAVLIVDAESQKIIEANPAATHLLGNSAQQVVGRTFPDGIHADSAGAVQALLTKVKGAGQADDVRVRLAHHGDREYLVSASLFRQDTAAYLLVRVTSLEQNATAAVPKAKSRLLEVVDSLPDGFLVTALDGRILTCNRAFLDLAQLATEEQARGQLLERWLGRPGVDLSVLLANLRQHGLVRLFSTTLRGEFGSTTDVEISAVAVQSGPQPCLGFTVRNVGRRLASDSRAPRELPRSVEQLTELIGKVSLKDLVRETTDVIERMCIEAALELTRDNRASAAEMLGVSRQSLYVKLRRYGMIGAEEDHDV